MDESQSSEHKEAYWRRVILKWVKCADLATSYDSIDLDTCYTNFRCKINVYCDVHESTVAEFLRAQFPDFELELNKENGIPKCDAVYVFSLMLYFSCIRHPIPYFQNIGKEFDVAYQQSMKAFLNSFVSKDGNQIVINRSFLDKAFQNAKPFANVLNDESCNRSVLSQQMITSTPIGKHEIKKPSPSTPKSVALEWKLKNLNALLEAAQSENISQDREIERLLQHVKELQEEKKMYQAKINILQLNETCACGNDLTNLPNPSSRITEQLQKQLESKDSVIEQLQEELSKLKESISTEMERYMTMKKQYGMLQEDNQRMKLAAEELKEEITMKETCNQNLFEIVKDLRRFISENHVQGAGLMESLESTFEFLDQSFKNMASDDSQGYDSENLASTVVDIKLKEKEHELEAMTKKTQELEHDLQAMTEDLNRQLERDKTLIKDLSCQMELQKQINLELSQKTVELRQALAEAEKDKSQLTEDLEKNKASVKDLSSQLAELDQKTAELQQALANTERGKLLLADDIEEFKAKVKELQSQLEEKVRVQIELNEKNIGLLQALAEAEKGKSQLLDDLGKEKSKTADLNRRLEQVEKTKAFHEQSYANVSDEMVKQISALQLHLDQEKEKSDEINCQYVQVRRQADDLDKQCTKLMQKLAEDQNEIANLQQQLAAKDAKLNELCALHEEKEKSDEINCQYMKVRQQADDLDKQCTKLRQKLAEDQNEIANLQQQLAAKDAKLNELCTLHEEKEKSDEYVQARRQADDLDEQCTKLRQKLAEDQHEIANLQQQLAAKDAKLNELCALHEEKEKSARQQADDLDKQCTKLRQKLAEDQNEIANLQQQLAAKDAKLNELCTLHEEKEKSARQQADDLDKQCTKLRQKLAEDQNEIANLQQQLAAKDAKLNELCALHEEKVKQLEKSCKDGEIFAMKLFRARHALTEKEELWAQERSTMAKVMEEKLRDARIEHDSKMAKMKDRMVELHKEGKTKLESDVQGLLLTVDGYKRKVENLEVRCAKLQQQLAEMNERNLEVRKENQLLQIRIKSMDEFGNDRKSVLLPSQANLRNNFKMEDEEGELFNNMYLADLKSGRCVSPGPSTSNGGVNRFFELSQRNSMVLPHLRTNYVALEPDCDPPQDDTRENMSTTFDDSSTGLISRRKVSGITSYKRPGPPTPSKRAGRLSLTGALSVNGGGEVQYKEVLRDANANVAVTSGGGGAAAAAGIVGSAADSAARTRRTKTPGKFKQMISSSSLLNNFQRDEDNASTLPMGTAYQQRCVVDSTPQAIPSNTLLRLNVATNQKRLQRELLFDSNRCLSESVPTVDERTTVPLGTILECPLAKEEQEQVFTDCNALGGSIAVPPGTAIRTTTDSYSFSSSRTIPSTVLDMTAAASTTTTTVTDTSFQHPYGCSRYNILRKQELRREKRRQLYDRTRKLVPKGKHCASVAISIGSPNVDVQHGKDGNVTTNQYEDVSLHYGFTSVDMEDSAIPTVNYPLTLSTSNRAGTGTIPLFLLFAALIGMLAQLMLCLGDLDSNTLLRANGS